nr:2-succinyl-5-enolpyruvyl-6-hydroxy-3-cyclohexene-1-carboxylic-acid synthase [Coraliomargarita akajimensis]
MTMEVLARLGVELVVISPGSRSTPLTVAAARNPKLATFPVLDERSAGFIALGHAKRSRRPVALVCTSGSAAVNYAPALLEASMSGTPLLVLTADRPPELRDCSSGQTIDQLKLYGDQVRSFTELGLPSVEAEQLQYLRQQLVHAVDRSLNGNPGPVHLNFPFRDPLVPIANAMPVVSGEQLKQAATVMTRPCESVSYGAGFDAVAVERMCSHTKGLIVVGDVNPRDGDESFADAVAMLSDKLGWPVLCDVLNPLRGHARENRALITRYDAILRDPTNAEELQPTAVLQIGALPTSKVLRQWLKYSDAVAFLLSDRPMNLDPLHRVAIPLTGSAHTFAESLIHQQVNTDWFQSWLALEWHQSDRLDRQFEGMDDLFEGKAAWLMSKHVPVGSTVFFASSMSVRYAEYFWCSGSRAYTMLSNRGANGIDGTLGTALGAAHKGAPCFLLTGDLAFLHDSNAMLASKDLDGSLTVLLINNHGGGIFEHLPVADQIDSFERFFATPQSVDIAKLCEAHGVAHQSLKTWHELTDALLAAPSPGLRVVELQTDRKADVGTLRSLLT